MEANIAPLLCLQSVGNLGSILLYCLSMCYRLYGCSIVFVSGKVMHKVQFSYNISKILHN